MNLKLNISKLLKISLIVGISLGILADVIFWICGLNCNSFECIGCMMFLPSLWLGLISLLDGKDIYDFSFHVLNSISNATIFFLIFYFIGALVLGIKKIFRKK